MIAPSSGSPSAARRRGDLVLSGSTTRSPITAPSSWRRPRAHAAPWRRAGGCLSTSCRRWRCARPVAPAARTCRAPAPAHRHRGVEKNSDTSHGRARARCRTAERLGLEAPSPAEDRHQIVGARQHRRNRDAEHRPKRELPPLRPRRSAIPHKASHSDRVIKPPPSWWPSRRFRFARPVSPHRLRSFESPCNKVSQPINLGSEVRISPVARFPLRNQLLTQAVLRTPPTGPGEYSAWTSTSCYSLVEFHRRLDRNWLLAHTVIAVPWAQSAVATRSRGITRWRRFVCHECL